MSSTFMPPFEVGHCVTCRLRSDLCVCRLAPRLVLPDPIGQQAWFLLMHEREQDKPTNTGKLLLNSLPNSYQHIWQRKEDLNTVLDAFSENSPVLLFPDDDASKNETDQKSLSLVELHKTLSEPPMWIIVDATWQQAHKMLRQSHVLQGLPRFSLSAIQPSQFTLRRNQQGLSTLESAAALLAAQNAEQAATQLLDYLNRFQQHFEAHRSNHPVQSY